MSKPIQEYSNQEKIAAMLECNPIRSERHIAVRYLLAVRREDATLISYFESFGECAHVIIRNVNTYERGLLYGYSGKKFNEYGWITGMLPIIEQIDLDNLNAIHIGRSINGTYAVTVSWSAGGAGGGSYPAATNLQTGILTGNHPFFRFRYFEGEHPAILLNTLEK